ncbi:glycoside hydrolase [Pedobacter sp. PACM 27299]|uniref:glycoside hydrolase family 18 protein n=1 Tax=Pedobacter sp. PACM 27299 TaxID=1727164 RepID=UPI000705FDB7|nr:glycoside hydrolase family 18 protein [Pedobacter sp. PACM 27299]ALL06948.1 glycoside hydrolase [Pedobacter sp. PACM 27299]
MKKITKSMIGMLVFCTACFAQATKEHHSNSKKIIVAYLTSWTTVLPDPQYVTHVNYAFGHVNEDFNGIRIDNENRLRSLVALKKKHPSLKVLLSVGGWGSGRFSEMAALKANRTKFAEDCLRVIREFKLDGIDIDWEYPTSNMAKISAAAEDTENYTLLMKVIREKIGAKKLLTLATAANAKYIDFKSIAPVVDFVNIMTYDMGNPPGHHAGLYRSKYTSGISVDEAVTAHVAAGMPINKLVLGIPFYGHGKDGIPNFIDYKEVLKLVGFKQEWDEAAQAPFLTNAVGDFVCTYEDPKSIAIKCKYLLDRGMLGAMYWDYSGDTDDGVLRKTVHTGVNK